MKLIRITGLAAIATIALMASLGTGSAFAFETVLCKVSPPGGNCAVEDRYPDNTRVESNAKELTINASDGQTYICGPSLLEFAGETVKGQSAMSIIGAMSSGPCKRKKLFGEPESCTTTSDGAVSPGSLLWMGGTGWDVLELATSGWAFNWEIQCGMYIDCKFLVRPQLEVKKGSPSTVIATKEPMTLSGGGCPASATWSATYTIDSPSPVYVAKIPFI